MQGGAHLDLDLDLCVLDFASYDEYLKLQLNKNPRSLPPPTLGHSRLGSQGTSLLPPPVPPPSLQLVVCSLHRGAPWPRSRRLEEGRRGEFPWRGSRSLSFYCHQSRFPQATVRVKFFRYRILQRVRPCAVSRQIRGGDREDAETRRCGGDLHGLLHLYPSSACRILRLSSIAPASFVNSMQSS